MNIKEKAKELCKEKNISLNKLEQEIDVASGYLSKLDNPGIKTVKLIADYFDVSVDFLIGDTKNNPFALGKEHAELIKIYEKLNKDEKEQIINTIKLLIRKK